MLDGIAELSASRPWVTSTSPIILLWLPSSPFTRILYASDQPLVQRWRERYLVDATTR